MATVESALQSQIRNIEEKHGRTMDDWAVLFAGRGLGRHGEMMPVLKNEFGLSHGNANRVALEVLARVRVSSPTAVDKELVGWLRRAYEGAG
jgi:Domain of unknown function (DUF4287)